MTKKKRRINRSATDRLREVIEAELDRQGLAGEEAAREARLPANSFRSLLRKGHRPSIDRAEELLLALGISMILGKTPTSGEVAGAAADEEQKSAGK